MHTSSTASKIRWGRLKARSRARIGGEHRVHKAWIVKVQATDGQLRDIDRLATACLRSASRRKIKTVDRELLQDAIDADVTLD